LVVEIYMKVLLAGANSYIGTRLVPVLLEKGHEVVCLVRDKGHFHKSNPYSGSVTVMGGDLLRRQSIEAVPGDIDAAYYLVNTFTQTSEFAALGALSAQNFMEVLTGTNCRHIITLGDINDTATDRARMQAEDILCRSSPELTVLNTTMMIGQGSTALEMFSTLTAKTPILIPQNWIKARSQPISASDVSSYLEACLLNEKTYNKKFDIGGPEVLSFKQMLLIYIAINKDFKPGIVVLPFLTAQLSSQLLNTLTPISYPGAQSLIENLKHDTICRENSIKDIIARPCLTFKESLRLANALADRVSMQNAQYSNNQAFSRN
jgi:uncharacterized protein YbjT (DUF2867 family)